MALTTLRLAPRCYLFSQVSPKLLNSVFRVPATSTMSTAFDERKAFWDNKTHPTATEEMNIYWQKNERLNRPQSPWLVYRLEFQSALSATHRATGFGMTIALWAIGFTALAGVDAQTLLSTISAFGINATAMSLTKSFIVWPFFYHALNGCRHLTWDAGKAFELETVYKTGYVVAGLSAILAFSAGFLPGML